MKKSVVLSALGLATALAVSGRYKGSSAADVPNVQWYWWRLVAEATYDGETKKVETRKGSQKTREKVTSRLIPCTPDGAGCEQ